MVVSSLETSMWKGNEIISDEIVSKRFDAGACGGVFSPVGDEQGGGFYMTFFDDGYKIKGKKVNVRHEAMHGLRPEVEGHIGAFCSAP
jgi:hypothetical protein